MSSAKLVLLGAIGVVAFALVYFLVHTSSKTELSAAGRAGFVAGMRNTCTARLIKEGSRLPEETIAAYCKCNAEGSLEGLTAEQISRVKSDQPPPPEILTTLHAIGLKCAANLQSRVLQK